MLLAQSEKTNFTTTQVTAKFIGSYILI